jgi:threonine dehydrogenase-like Zn-dependent dehydrogenase
VSDEAALLADPFAVSLHAVLKAPPEENSLAVVYGCRTLGLLTVGILKTCFPSVAIIAITRFPQQEELAKKFGADHTTRTRNPLEIIEKVADVVGTGIYRPWQGRPLLMRGPARIYDTVGSPETLEVGIRIAQPQGVIVVSGVDLPARFEWTPLYFKEIQVIGSNAFGIENFGGESRHGIDIYLDLLSQGRLDPTALITHRYPLEAYRQAFLDASQHGRSGSVKVIFDFQSGESS